MHIILTLYSIYKCYAYCFAWGDGLDATLWLLVIMYIGRSSAKSDLSTPFPDIQ